MKQNKFIKIFISCALVTLISYSFAGYAARRAQIASPDAFEKLQKRYNIVLNTYNVEFDNGRPASVPVKRREKTWDAEGTQKKIDIAVQKADVLIEKSPDEKIHIFADGEQPITENELFDVEIKSNEVTIKESGENRTSSLRVQLPSHVQKIEFKSVTGDFELQNIRAEAVQAATVSGDLHLHEIAIREIDGLSISGDVSILPDSFEELKVGTTSGNVTIESKDLEASELSLKTMSGTIAAPQGLKKSKKKVKVRTISGDIELIKAE